MTCCNICLCLGSCSLVLQSSKCCCASAHCSIKWATFCANAANCSLHTLGFHQHNTEKTATRQMSQNTSLQPSGNRALSTRFLAPSCPLLGSCKPANCPWPFIQGFFFLVAVLLCGAYFLCFACRQATNELVILAGSVPQSTIDQ